MHRPSTRYSNAVENQPKSLLNELSTSILGEESEGRRTTVKGFPNILKNSWRTMRHHKKELDKTTIAHTQRAVIRVGLDHLLELPEYKQLEKARDARDKGKPSLFSLMTTPNPVRSWAHPLLGMSVGKVNLSVSEPVGNTLEETSMTSGLSVSHLMSMAAIAGLALWKEHPEVSSICKEEVQYFQSWLTQSREIYEDSERLRKLFTQ